MFLLFISENATNFMKASSGGSESAQLITVRRCKYFFERNGYRSVGSENVYDMYQLSLLTLKEETKFLTYIKESLWPAEMRIFQGNLLHATIFEKHIIVNARNDDSVLECSQSSFKRRYLYKAETSSGSENEVTNDELIERGAYASSSNDANDYAEISNPFVNRSVMNESETETNVYTNVEKLRSPGNLCHQMTWKGFWKKHWSEEASKNFNLILTDPPVAHFRSFLRGLQRTRAVYREITPTG